MPPKRFSQPGLFQAPKPPDYRARRRELRRQIAERQRRNRRERTTLATVSFDQAVRLAEWALSLPATKEEK